MALKQIVILGAGGHAREIADICQACAESGIDYALKGFLVEPGFGDIGMLVNGKPILGYFDWLENNSETVYLVSGVGDPRLKQRFVETAKRFGGQFINLIHPSVIFGNKVSIGEGVVIAAGSILTNQVKIGDHVHINLACTISHDVVLGQHVMLAPGVRVSGNVHVEEGAFIGTGATIIEKKRVGRWAVIGAGTVIVEDVAAHTTSVGVPGKAIKTKKKSEL